MNSEEQSGLLPFRNLVEALAAAPADRPFITFWIDEDEQETVTFGEFRRRARAQACLLLDHGVTSGDRVVIVMPQGIAGMTVFAGAMTLGAVPAFLAYPNFKIEPSKYRAGLSGVTANLGAKAVVIDNEFPEEMLECVALTGDARLVRVPTLSRETDIDKREFVTEKTDLESVAFIQHSAGTTGLQKGVALTHASVLRQLRHLSSALSIDSSDRIYSWLPLYHDMGLIACFILPMVCHLPVVMQSPVDWVMHPESMLQIMSEHRCTLAWMPNFGFQFVARRTPENKRSSYDLSSVRALINCSEPVRAESMAEFGRAFVLQATVMQSSFAMAENVFAVTQSSIDQALSTLWVDGKAFRSTHRIVPVSENSPAAISFTSSGRLLPGHHLRVEGQSSADNPEVGEIVIKSNCLFEGYYNRPDLTAQSMKDGWYHTGDLGFVQDGELFVVGRKKDLLIVGGENIYPQDIEEIVSGHPAIHDGRVVATGIHNPSLGTEEIVVVAEVESEPSLEDAAVIEQEIRRLVVSGMGVAVKDIFLKPPRWIVKSTAGKAARSATREKLLKEYPQLES